MGWQIAAGKSVFSFFAFVSHLGAEFGPQMAPQGEKNENPDFLVTNFQPTFSIRKIDLGIDSDRFYDDLSTFWQHYTPLHFFGELLSGFWSIFVKGLGKMQKCEKSIQR